jgi:hypothetical protein
MTRLRNEIGSLNHARLELREARVRENGERRAQVMALCSAFAQDRAGARRAWSACALRRRADESGIVRPAAMPSTALPPPAIKVSTAALKQHKTAAQPRALPPQAAEARKAKARTAVRKQHKTAAQPREKK